MCFEEKAERENDNEPINDINPYDLSVKSELHIAKTFEKSAYKTC